MRADSGGRQAGSIVRKQIIQCGPLPEVCERPSIEVAARLCFCFVLFFIFEIEPS